MKIYLLAITVFTTWASGSFAELPPEHSSDLKAAAHEFILQLKDEKFGDAEKRFDENMRKALPASQLQSAWRATLQANGGLTKLEASRINHVSNWDIVDTPCVYEKSTAVIRISFDKQQQIAGLFFFCHR